MIQKFRTFKRDKERLNRSGLFTMKTSALFITRQLRMLRGVRTQDGRVIEADVGPVLDASKKFSAKLKPEDLEPPAPKR